VISDLSNRGNSDDLMSSSRCSSG